MGSTGKRMRNTDKYKKTYPIEPVPHSKQLIQLPLQERHIGHHTRSLIILHTAFAHIAQRTAHRLAVTQFSLLLPSLFASPLGFLGSVESLLVLVEPVDAVLRRRRVLAEQRRDDVRELMHHLVEFARRWVIGEGQIIDDHNLATPGENFIFKR